MTATADTITLRRATPDDAAALERLARLDSARLPRGPHLVATAGDDLVAALSLPTGRTLADPFVASAGAVGLLRERAAFLAGRGHRAGVPALALLRGLLPASPRRA